MEEFDFECSECGQEYEDETAICSNCYNECNTELSALTYTVLDIFRDLARFNLCPKQIGMINCDKEFHQCKEYTREICWKQKYNL